MPLKTEHREPSLSFDKRQLETSKNVQYYDQREIMTTPLSQERKTDTLNRQKYEEPSARSHRQ